MGVKKEINSGRRGRVSGYISDCKIVRSNIKLPSLDPILDVNRKGDALS